MAIDQSEMLAEKEIICYIKRVKIAGIAQLVERNLAKVDVAGPNPVSRSSCPVVFFLWPYRPTLWR